MKIVADENIPLVAELFGEIGDVVLLPGRAITAHDLKNADILLVRSVTTVNEKLLAHSKIKFVGSATAGTEHIDIAFLKQAGIGFAYAAGSNANAVADYVICSVAYLQEQNLLPKAAHAGIVGLGSIGRTVLEKLTTIGFNVLQNDPPRAEQEPHFISTPLTDFYSLDLICLHPSLTKTGTYPSYHLIDKPFLKKLKTGAVLLNASRGSVINSAELLAQGAQLIWSFDVWEHEPHIALDLLTKATLATPHIAGYTLEAKLYGTYMLYQAVQAALNRPDPIVVKMPTVELELASAPLSWREVVLQVYNPKNDTEKMRTALMQSPDNIAQQFDALRKHYPRRHEFASVILKNTEKIKDSDKNILRCLGLQFAG